MRLGVGKRKSPEVIGEDRGERSISSMGGEAGETVKGGGGGGGGEGREGEQHCNLQGKHSTRGWGWTPNHYRSGLGK